MLPVKREKGLGMNLMDLSITAKMIFQKKIFLHLEKLSGTHSTTPLLHLSKKERKRKQGFEESRAVFWSIVWL